MFSFYFDELSFLGAALSVVLSISSACSQVQKLENDTIYSERRAQMVQRQLIARDIVDAKVLTAMMKVKRHLFVPENYREYAYEDTPLPIDEDQTISQPYIVALMTQALLLSGKEKVLEIGTGSGYQAAVLAEIVDSVFTIEIIEPLAQQADSLLQFLEYNNALVKCGDGFAGWPEHAPFDGIIVTCAAPKIPPPLIEQLAEGGRMVIPVGDRYQELLLLTKTRGKLDTLSLAPVLFVPMTGEAKKKN